MVNQGRELHYLFEITSFYLKLGSFGVDTEDFAFYHYTLFL
jgi:hypothetical protein